MKVIGTIEPEFINNEGQISNGDYVGGKVVHLTSREVSVLKMLQDASDGNSWNWSNYLHFTELIESRNMADVFYCVYTYVQARFALDDFQKSIDNLRETLTKVEDKEGLRDLQ